MYRFGVNAACLAASVKFPFLSGTGTSVFPTLGAGAGTNTANKTIKAIIENY
ncbi:MAG: hypothetical protein IPL10_15375 [Bacteroidetes bacterium]|nr:hypothetical protein [Bacteroidota bacterium]